MWCASSATTAKPKRQAGVQSLGGCAVARPAMMSSICSHQWFPFLSSALAMACILSRLFLDQFCARLVLFVDDAAPRRPPLHGLSLMLVVLVTERPRNTSPSFSAQPTIGPNVNRSCRNGHHHVGAMEVARSKSLLAPVVIWFMNTSSAMRPPNSMLIWLSM